MRKFIGIVFYVFAGVFIGTLVVVSAGNYELVGDRGYQIAGIVAGIGMFFLFLAAWIHPSKEWKKHMAITIFSSTILMTLGNINQYFVIKGMQNSNIQTEYTKVLKDVPLEYNWTASMVVTVLLLGISFLLYKKG